MEDPHIIITIPGHAHQQAKEFLDFLRRAAKRHSVTIGVSSERAGRFKCCIRRKDGENFELFLQELMFNQGLYYYLCSVSNRKAVARSVVRPIFQELLEWCFEFIYPSLLRKHVLEGSGGWLAGEFAEGTAQQYEILFWRLKLKMISGYEFIRDLDDLLTEFMLYRLGHAKGQRSLKFNLLVDECGKKDILRDKELRKLFNKVHVLRTHGLHRLEREIPVSQLSQIALQMYFFFEYVDDYFQAQHEKTVMLLGKRYRRVRYGNEIRYWNPPMPEDFKVRWSEIIQSPCGDCGVVRGELHVDGCDIEACPRCGGQYLCCECRRDDDHDDEAAVDPSMPPSAVAVQ